MLIVLTEDQEHEALDAAKRRNAKQREWQRQDGKCDHGRASATVDIEGAIGERMIAKFSGLPWDGKVQTTFEQWQGWRDYGADVSGLEVKATRHRNGLLLVRPHNHSDRIYVLIILWSNREGWLAGWQYGSVIKQECNRDTERGGRYSWCYSLDQRSLRPTDELDAMIQRYHQARES